MKYKLITSSCPLDLSQLVTQALANGWEISGSAFAVTHSAANYPSGGPEITEFIQPVTSKDP